VYPLGDFIVARYTLANGGKTFRPVHRAAGKWSIGDPPLPLPLYRNDELGDDEFVFVAEGEKDIDALRSVGLLAVTSAHGAKSASKSDWTVLCGRDVIVIPDNDDAGRAYAADVAALLTPLGCTVRVVNLPGLPDKGDFSDWIGADGPMGDKGDDEIREAVLSLADNAEPLTPQGSMSPGEAGQAEANHATSPLAVRPSLMTVSELLAGFPTQREPVIDGLIRRGEVANLVSGPKMNKSWLLMHVALSIATGQSVLGFSTRRGRVLLLDYELSPGTLAKRLHAVMDAMGLSADEIGDRLAIESLRGRQLDINALGPYFAAVEPGAFDCVILDPLYRTYPSDLTDENSNVGLARLYGTLQRYAEMMNAAVIVCHHSGKGDQSGRGVTDVGAGGGSQSRAADAHLIIRPHAVDGCAVLSGVVRSFPPFADVAMRWDYPTWALAPDLDPADLRRPPKRASTKDKEPKPTPEPPKPVFDVAWLVENILRDTPQTKDSILALAVEMGLPNENQGKKLLGRAEVAKDVARRAFRWSLPKDNRTYYARIKQPDLAEGDQ